MTIRFMDADRGLVIGVRDLLQAGPARGHLRLDFAGSSAARLAAGRAVHETYQGRAAEENPLCAAEVSVKVTVVVRGWECTVRGRLDGLICGDERTVVEEIKSTGLDAGRLLSTDLDDWAQWRAQVDLYLWMLGKAAYPDPVGRLVLVSLVDGARHVLHVPRDAAAIDAFVMGRLGMIVREREARLAWLAKRRASAVPFAHADLREGQAAVIADVEDAVAQKRALLLTAPTGTGKTAAVLHAVLRQAYAKDLRVFVATAKGTQQKVVEETLAAIEAKGLPLRAVSIKAREKACINEAGVDCRPEGCRFAEDYFDKIEDDQVIERALEGGVRPPDQIAALAREHVVCPFELSLQVSDRVDVVIGDYNYVFGPWSYLRRHFGERHDDWVLVVDEAHNLVDRARDYGSPELTAAQASAAANFLAERGAHRFFAFVELCDDIGQAIEETAWRIDPGAPRRGGETVVSLNPRLFLDLRDRVDELALDYLRLRDPGWPEDPYRDLARAVARFAAVIEWSRAAADDAEEDILHLFRQDREAGPSVQLLCLDPSPWTRPRLSGFQSAVLMSATLRPAAFYRDLLGIPEDRAEVREHPSPFPPENRGVVIASQVSTMYRDRARERDRTARLIREVLEVSPGNAAVYYSSFGLLHSLLPLAKLADRKELVQWRRMDDDARAQMVADLVNPRARKPRVLHAVLGGIFAEGIDLPTGALHTVVVVGPALPQVKLQRDLFRGFCEERFDAGFTYAYLVPGMSRVVQAAGRVVRRAADRGVVVLVGRRFVRRDYGAFYPEDWQVRRAPDPAAWVRDFWAGQND